MDKVNEEVHEELQEEVHDQVPEEVNKEVHEEVNEQVHNVEVDVDVGLGYCEVEVQMRGDGLNECEEQSHLRKHLHPVNETCLIRILLEDVKDHHE